MLSKIPRKKRQRYRRWALLLCLCLLSNMLSPLMVVQAAEQTPVERYGKLSVSGSHLVDRDGNIVQLKGISTHGLAWYPQYITKKTFQTLRDKWGVEVIRLAMYTAEYNGYCTGTAENQKELRKLIYKAVQYADALGLYVILDWHILSDGNPNTYKEEANTFFKVMAKRYASHENVIYEICNEPNGGTSWTDIRSYAKTIIRSIRKYDEDGVIIAGTPTWSQDVEMAVQKPLSGDNIMYSFHFYAATHTSAYRKRLQAAIDAGLPVFVTEFGTCDASGNGSVNLKEADAWMKLLDENQISCIAWNLSNKEETCALLKSSCDKLSGWKRSDLTDSGKWVYDSYRKN